MSTLTYKVRANKDGNGGYNLNYGKGSKKITRRAVNPGGKGWRVIEAPPELLGVHPKLSDLKALFGAWCEKVYSADAMASNPLVDADPAGIIPPPPSARKKVGPPIYRAKRSDVSEHNQWLADPLNPDYFEQDDEGRRRYTETGVLVEVWSWARSHHENPWSVMPFTNVAKVLHRKYPDDKLFQPPTPVENSR